MTDAVQPTNDLRGAVARWALVLVVPAAIGAIIGGYLDWHLWHPSSGIVVTAGALLLLVVGGLALASAWRPIRAVALGILAFAIGGILGQNLGPSRPPVTVTDGTLTLALTQPAGAEPVSGRAMCQLTPDGESFEISGDPNLRLQIGDQPREERDPIEIAFTRGDMWEYGAEERDDGWSVRVTVGDAGPFMVHEVPVNVTMRSGRESEIAGDGSQGSGSLRFGNLVLDEGQSPGASGPIELAGTIEWSCAR